MVGAHDVSEGSVEQQDRGILITTRNQTAPLSLQTERKREKRRWREKGRKENQIG